MRAAALVLLLYGLGGCAPAERWFESESWFGDTPPSADAPRYIPLAAIPELAATHPSLKERAAQKQRLRQKRIKEK